MSRVVVGVDGSEHSQRALRWAIRLAQPRGWEVQVVVAYDAEPDPHERLTSRSRADSEEREREAWRILRGTVDPVSGLPDRLRLTVAAGVARDVLAEAARETYLVVVGSRGAGGFEGLLLGSVSRALLSRSSVPVAVVPPTALRPDRGQVVVGVDDSEPARAALRWAAPEAQHRDAVLEVVHVNAYASARTRTGQEVIDEPARRLCSHVVEDALGAGQETEVVIIGLGGHPAGRLLDRAEEADLLVVGGSGRGMFGAAILGSTAHACVTHATAPTVVVPANAPEARSLDAATG